MEYFVAWAPIGTPQIVEKKEELDVPSTLEINQESHVFLPGVH